MAQRLGSHASAVEDQVQYVSSQLLVTLVPGDLAPSLVFHRQQA